MFLDILGVVIGVISIGIIALCVLAYALDPSRNDGRWWK